MTRLPGILLYQRPAKFRIAATVPMNFDPAAANEDALWAELDRLTQSGGAAVLPEVPAGRAAVGGAEGGRPAGLAVEPGEEAAVGRCRRVDRRTGVKLGACKLASGARVSTHFHHTGEELFYRGTAGSGTKSGYFTGC